MNALKRGVGNGLRRVLIRQAAPSTAVTHRRPNSQKTLSACPAPPQRVPAGRALQGKDFAGGNGKSGSGSSSSNNPRNLLSVPILCSLGGVAVASAESRSAATQTDPVPPAPSDPAQPAKELVAKEDLYGGVNIDPSSLPSDPQAFTELLSSHLAKWKAEGKRGIWIKIPESLAGHIPLAVSLGFKFHHANDGFVMMAKWLPDTPNTLPHNASHYVGVGVAVIDEQGRILVVQERHGPAAARGKDFWKVPTGLVNHSEDMAEAAEREVLEETGIRVQFEGVVAFREQHRAGVEGKTDMFFMCLARPLSTDIAPCPTEIAEAKWMSAEEYANLPIWPEGSVYWLLTRLAVEHSLKGKGQLKGPRLNAVPKFVPQKLPRGFGDMYNFVYSGAPQKSNL